ncbi:hypothetical protein [Streptomyces sp. NPDC002088]|uniref:hypothetical protein n=1 Tax=Streptomyces sp. NPDC002088 TaxID=3154665 RepID=UPI003325BDF8
MILRHQLPHEVLAELSEVDRSTVSEAVRQVRPLLAARGFAVPRPARGSAEDTGGRVRLRRSRGHRAEARRCRDPSTTPAGVTPRTPGLRVRQA